jgi:cytochrome c peroxidase
MKRLAMAALIPASILGACSDDAGTGADRAAAARVGAKIFSDASLSASGSVACATCHVPSRAHASAETVDAGGAALDRRGRRNSPSLRYLDASPPFYFDDAGTPTGGFNRDGRADSLAQQARRPFLAPHEMANADAAALTERLAQARYAGEFRALYGEDIFTRPDDAFDRATRALAAFQDSEPFHPFSSKYDDFLAGRVALTDAELRGLALFNNPQKGNCAACHPGSGGGGGAPPLFTDFTYDNLGVPRNAAIAANDDPAFFDLGLCGPDRDDLAADHPELCGAFKVPTLRNVARTAPYFHNGRFATLQQVLRFYVTRDTDPGAWYPSRKFDDLPDAYLANVNTTEPPYDRHPGDAPALDDDEIADVIAFLNTLTDADLR